MVCAIAYEYRSLKDPVKDIESSSASNNNDKTNDFMDKNLTERAIKLGPENGQELIEKGTNRPQKEDPIQKKDREKGR